MRESEASSTGVASHRWALVVAHPGHELRAFHFLELARPRVAVLTDGSGSTGVPRADETRRLLADAGATPDEVFAVLSDREAYAAMMAHDAGPFVRIAHALSRSFAAHGITAVLTDAAEGYNPVHDVCRAITATAVRLGGSRMPVVYEFDLVGHPNGDGAGIRLQLDDAAFRRKLDAARRYAALLAEAGAAFEQHGVDAFRHEFLRQSGVPALLAHDGVPDHERVGDERVREGRYTSTLRFRQHVKPILDTLQSAGAPDEPALSLDSRH